MAKAKPKPPDGASRLGASKRQPRRSKTPIVWDEGKPLWERQATEADQAYEAFRLWLASPLPRPTYRQFIEAHGYKPATLLTWTGRYAWTERADAWDSSIVQEARAEVVKIARAGAEAAAQRQADHASRLGELVSHELDKMLRESRENPQPTVTPKTLLAMMAFALQLENLANGEDVEKIEQRPNFNALSDEDVKALHGMAVKALGSGS